jgi:hypothetical protein
MKIRKFKFNIGGYFGASYSLEYKKGMFQYRANEMEPIILIEQPPKNWDFSKVKNSELIQYDSTNEDLKISKEKLTQFVKYVSRYCKSWDKEFMNDEILDGTSWSCDIWIDDFRLKSNGQNEYPSNFNSFLNKLSALTSGKIFE